jgi:PBP1b-binding outer membrane lipoprotein LpoB
MRCTLFLCLSTALFLSACSPAAEPETKTATDAPAAPAAAADVHAGSGH